MRAPHRVLVMHRECFGGLKGFVKWKTAKNILIHAMSSTKWLTRPEAERSSSWVQPIPCAIIYDDSMRFGVFKRIRSSRNDLSEKISLIIGGHVEEHFFPHNYLAGESSIWQIMIETLRRELVEEVSIVRPHSIRPFGLVIDRETPASSRHVALVCRVRSTTIPTVRAHEEFAADAKISGTFHATEHLKEMQPRLDPWSKRVIEELV